MALLLLLLYEHKVPDTAVPLCCYTTDRLGHYRPNVSDLTHRQTVHTRKQGYTAKVYARARMHPLCGCDLAAARRLRYSQTSAQ